MFSDAEIQEEYAAHVAAIPLRYLPFAERDGFSVSWSPEVRRARQAAWKAARRCQLCGDALDPTSRCYCPDHLNRRRDSARYGRGSRNAAASDARKAAVTTAPRSPIGRGVRPVRRGNGH